MRSQVAIGSRTVGVGRPVYIVAEMSANHGGDFDRAVAIVKAAKDAGADAIKLQTFTADVHTLDSDKKYFRVGGGTLWDGRTLYDLYREAQMPWEWQPRLKTVALEAGLDFFSAAVDPTSVDFLESIGVPVHKASSFELVDIPLIEKMARTGKPLILSTGMATLEEIREAVDAGVGAGAREIILLKCTSSYPAPPEEMNLRTITDLAARFGFPVGLSDHTAGVTVPVAAVALGACMIEKHFTLSRSLPGPDSAFSVEPGEFKAMVDAVRTAERALGRVQYGPAAAEVKNLAFRRSLFVVKNVKAGECFSDGNVRSIRPGHGLHPRHLREVLCRRASRDIEAGTPLSWDLINKPES